MRSKITALVLSSTFKDTFVSLGGNAGVALGGMLFTVILARALTTEEFGIYSSLWALSVLLSSVGDMGISSALVNFLPKIKQNRHLYLSVTFWFQLAITAFIGLTLVIVSPLTDRLIPGSTPALLLATAAMTCVYILSGFGLSVLKAERKFFLTSLLQVGESLNKLILLALFFFLGSIDIMLALVVAALAAVFTVIISLKNEFAHIGWFFPKAQIREIIGFTRWIALMRIFSVAVARVDILILGKMAGSYQAGIFAAASRLSLLFVLLVSSLGSVVAPRFSSFTDKKQVAAYVRKVSLLIGGISLLMVACVILARPIILIVFGDKYLDAIPVFQLLTFAMLPFLLSIITVNPLIYAFNQPRFIALVTIIQVVILVILDILLIPRYQAFAPTISLAVSNLFVLLVTGYRLYKELK